MLGSLGDITFRASSDLVRTFAEYSETISARLATHEIAGAYPITEYLGKGLRTRSLPISLNATMGVDVEGTIQTAREHCNNGDLLPFMMGGRVLGGPSAFWIIEEVSVTATAFDRKGATVLATMVLTIRLAQTASTPSLAPASVQQLSSGNFRLLPPGSAGP